MDNEGIPGEPSAATPSPSLVQRVIMVFVSPGKLGEQLRSASPWFWTLAIVAVVSTAIVLLMPADLLLQAAEEQMRARGQAAEPPSVAVMRGFGAGGALLGTFVAASVVGGVLYLVFNVVFGQAESSFTQHISATAHVFWITLLGGAILLPLQISSGDVQMKLGLGLLLADEPSSFFGHFLNNITIFGLWAATALGFVESGLSGGRISGGKATGAVIALYLVWSALSAGLAAAF